MNYYMWIIYGVTYASLSYLEKCHWNIQLALYLWMSLYINVLWSLSIYVKESMLPVALLTTAEVYDNEKLRFHPLSLEGTICLIWYWIFCYPCILIIFRHQPLRDCLRPYPLALLKDFFQFCQLNSSETSE